MMKPCNHWPEAYKWLSYQLQNIEAGGGRTQNMRERDKATELTKLCMWRQVSKHDFSNVFPEAKQSSSVMAWINSNCF